MQQIIRHILSPVQFCQAGWGLFPSNQSTVDPCHHSNSHFYFTRIPIVQNSGTGELFNLIPLITKCYRKNTDTLNHSSVCAYLIRCTCFTTCKGTEPSACSALCPYRSTCNVQFVEGGSLQWTLFKLAHAKHID